MVFCYSEAWQQIGRMAAASSQQSFRQRRPPLHAGGHSQDEEQPGADADSRAADGNDGHDQGEDGVLDATEPSTVPPPVAEPSSTDGAPAPAPPLPPPPPPPPEPAALCAPLSLALVAEVAEVVAAGACLAGRRPVQLELLQATLDALRPSLDPPPHPK
jgi:hypothetical protein